MQKQSALRKIFRRQRRAAKNDCSNNSSTGSNNSSTGSNNSSTTGTATSNNRNNRYRHQHYYQRHRPYPYEPFTFFCNGNRVQVTPAISYRNYGRRYTYQRNNVNGSYGRGGAVNNVDGGAGNGRGGARNGRGGHGNGRGDSAAGDLNAAGDLEEVVVHLPYRPTVMYNNVQPQWQQIQVLMQHRHKHKNIQG
ncbi:uncharacterized protein [Musca autumnalis]|uniref:uncharacterized protein n=1 Tax=Musca autumnalis TaxID=221902 RepID=UPI003CE83BD7